MTRLQEFINLARRCYYQYTRSAKNNGNVRVLPLDWGELGSGFYGVALQHNDYPEYCLKISGRAGWGDNTRYGVELENKRLDAWPVFAEHCKNSPHLHLPEILHLERVSESMTWGVMPVYEPSYERYCRFSNSKIDDIVSALCGEIECPEWLWPLRQMTSGLYIQIDLHDGNIMHNPKTGTFVITDPFSTTGDS